MKELAIYLHFIRTYIFLILISSCIGFVVCLIFFFNSPKNYVSEYFYELEYSNANVEQKKLETDELIAVLRGGNTNGFVGVGNVQTEVYKPGPISLHVRLIGANNKEVNENMKKIQEYLFSHTAIHEINHNVYTEDSHNFTVVLLLGLFVGASLGVVLALVHTYVRNF